MKRIPIFIGGITIGGIQRVFFTLAAELDRQGHKVDLIMTEGSADISPYIPSPKNIRVVLTGSRKLRASLPGLMRYMKEEKPAFILAGSPSNTLLLIFARALSGSKAKIIGGIHCVISRSKSVDLQSRLLYILIKLFFGQVDLFIGTSNYSSGDFSGTVGIPPEKIRTIYNPVISDLTFRLSKSELDDPFFKDRNIPVISGIGRFFPEKNFGLLIDSFDILRKRKQVRLALIGDGPERNKLEGLIKKKGLEGLVKLTGCVQNPYPYISASSLIAVPSLHEALNTVLIESLALGTPVVATDCPGGNREILDGGKYGKLVKMNDPAAMAKAIEELLDRPPDKELLKKRGLDFQAGKIAKEYLEALESI